MFQKLSKNLVAYPLFALVFLLQIYFALILMAAPALATENSSAEIEKSLDKTDGAKVDTRTVNVKNSEKKNDVKISLNLSDENKDGKKSPGLHLQLDDGEKIDINDSASLKKFIQLMVKEKVKNTEDIGNLEATLSDSGIKMKIADKQPKASAEVFFDAMEDILIPIALFLCIALAISSKSYFNYKSRQNYLEVVKLAVEKGQPIPAEINAPEQTKFNRPWQDDMSRGTKMFFVGLGMAIFFFYVGAPWAIGIFVSFIGIGSVASAYIKKSTTKN